MPALLFFFASGKSFFFGIGLIILASVVLSLYRSFFTGILLRITLLGGYFLVIMSATPLPGWFYWCWFLVLLAFFICNILSSDLSRKANLLMAIPLILASLIGLFVELPWQFTSGRSNATHDQFYIIGDSISDGIGRETTWPDLLAEEHSINVINLAVAGATCQTALSQARQIRTENALVLLEIGGNDLLGNQSAKDFGKDLKALIERISKNGHTIFLIELPLDGFKREYGRIQRRLAKEHGIALIPKRYFADVLSADNATLDGIHLSKTGHEKMAEMVWDQIANNIIKTDRSD